MYLEGPADVVPIQGAGALLGARALVGVDNDADALASFAVTAAALGFDTIWLSDVPLAPIGASFTELTLMAMLFGD